MVQDFLDHGQSDAKPRHFFEAPVRLRSWKRHGAIGSPPFSAVIRRSSRLFSFAKPETGERPVEVKTKSEPAKFASAFMASRMASAAGASGTICSLLFLVRVPRNCPYPLN